MKDYMTDSPEFSKSIRIVETSDPAHADNVNAAPKQLLQNTLANRAAINTLMKKMDSLLSLVYRYSYDTEKKLITSFIPHDCTDGILTFPEGMAYAENDMVVLNSTPPSSTPTNLGGDIGDGQRGSVEEIAAAGSNAINEKEGADD